MSNPLLGSRRFLPLFTTQALGAFNDNLFKNALVVIILYRSAQAAGGNAGPLVALAGGCFVLPYVLFSTLAGQLADQYDKAGLIRLTKLFELGVMLLAGMALVTGSLAAMFAVLFGLGVQATFFGPLKYGILPDHLQENELISGNAQIEAGTFAAILVGTIAGGGLAGFEAGAEIVGVLGIACSLAGMAAAWMVLPAPSQVPARDRGLDWNVPRAILALTRQARGNRPVWLSLMGISWFWALGSIVLTEFPVIVKDVLHARSDVVTALLAVFAIGVGCGSIFCGRLMKGEISARYVPFAALGLSLFAWDFAASCSHAAGLTNLGALAASPAGWRLMADLFLLAFAGGVYSVPLYTIMQERSEPAFRSRMIATNNILNAVFMVLAAIIIAGLAAIGWSAPRILALASLCNLLVALYICRLLPNAVMQGILRWYFAVFHKAEVKGLENLRDDGRRKVVVINHLSLLDGCFIAAYLPGEPVFVVNTHVAQWRLGQLMQRFVEVLAVDPANPFSAKTMIKMVKSGRILAIFPEGRVTRTGTLMKIYEGAGMVADKADADLIPVHIEGLEFSKASYMGDKLRLRWFPKLRLTVMPPVRLDIDPALTGRNRRRITGMALQDLMVRADFATHDLDRGLFPAFRAARARFGGQSPMAEDVERKPLSYDRLLLGATILGRQCARLTGPAEKVGVLLPNATGTLVTFLALISQARVPAMLNFSSGVDAMLSCCRAAQIRTVITSRRFIERAKLQAVADRLGQEVHLVYLEDVTRSIGWRAKLGGMISAKLGLRLPGDDVGGDTPAVVLFTSGSEGTPKGVVLSHRNLLANDAQLASVVDFNAADRVMNAMPMFHSFGLTGGTILPLLHGIRTFFYPSPLHYKIVPELIYDTDATIVFGTDTFLNGWARFAHPYDFYAVRYIFAGAERLKEETRALYANRFGVRVLEGYGATETAPVISINTAMHNRPGTVGRVLPGIDCRLEPVPGIEKGGRLFVKGPNVMLGYLKADQPGVLQPPEDGWYDTGDIVTLDADGFLAIKGRAKRFAKIAGEMVSMTAAEGLAARLWPDAAHGVVAIADARKGEQLVLATTQADATAEALLAAARTQGTAEIAVPRMVKVMEKLPLLGTGKLDYPALQELVETEPRLAQAR
ncbi:MAG TPA: acyl-[ACP]--phospholipid O-acyltransferase [Stellaceae bacterium]|nr:acyl-[ACP]--phospholipid O-acyltransferase [Stellaceae bacterium]